MATVSISSDNTLFDLLWWAFVYDNWGYMAL